MDGAALEGTASTEDHAAAAHDEARAGGAAEAASADAVPAATADADAEASVEQSSAPVEGCVARWCACLLSQSPEECGRQSFSAWAAKNELTEPNQRVIRADCERTRGDTQHFRRQDVRAKMEAMLTCWCQEQGARYKQGLNEVLAPFLYLQEHPTSSAPDDDLVFVLFTAFLRRFVPFFDSENFVPLQCAFVFFRRLLLYHHPDLHNLLVEKGISPDMFCTPWFLTLFASKMSLQLTIELWDRVIERNEPPFFIYIAVAMLANFQQAIFSAERSLLPEILASLTMTSTDDLGNVWSIAECLQRETPGTFAARLRRNALRGGRKPSTEKGGEEQEEMVNESDAADRMLERLEQERCFFVLPEEVVGHCYPPRPGEARRPWHPPSTNTWRLLVLDLRPTAEFEITRLPAALHFDLSAVEVSQSSQASNASKGAGGTGLDGVPVTAPTGWAAVAGAAGRRLRQWRHDPTVKGLEPVRTFEALKGILGEDWVCDREAHICLLGSASKGAQVRQLFEIMTLHLTLRHVSVASGGYEAVVACAQRQSLEIIRNDESMAILPAAIVTKNRVTATDESSAVNEHGSKGESRSDMSENGEDSGGQTSSVTRTGSCASNASENSDASDIPGSRTNKWASLQPFAQVAGSAWSGLRRASDATRAAAAAVAEKTASVARANAENADKSDGQPVSAHGPVGKPQFRDRPGNWPLDVNLDLLPRRQREPLVQNTDLVEGSAANWSCIAIAVKDLEGLWTCSDNSSKSTPWAGCNCNLSIVDSNLILWKGEFGHNTGGEPPDNADTIVVLADFSVSRVLRVTSKKQAPDVLMIYSRWPENLSKAEPDSPREEQPSANSYPSLVLYFPDGSSAVRNFISILRSKYTAGACAMSANANTADTDSDATTAETASEAPPFEPGRDAVQAGGYGNDGGAHELTS